MPSFSSKESCFGSYEEHQKLKNSQTEILYVCPDVWPGFFGPLVLLICKYAYMCLGAREFVLCLEH